MKTRRWPALAVLLVALAALVSAAPAPAAGLRAVEAVGFTVSDLDRSVAFFTQALGFRELGRAEVLGPEVERLEGVFGARLLTARLRLGTETVELVEYLAPRGRPVPADSRGNDRWFQHLAIVVRDMDRAYQVLREHRVEHLSSGPQTLPAWNPDAAGIRAFYFRDPDGHPLELIQYPPGKGDPRWQRPGQDLFLGIDHTAIVVADTEASLRFYRDLLGMRVAGTSENHGTEQEHLNGVFGARLRITALRAPAGPGIELLEYRTPRDGRPRPPDARSNDLLTWRTGLVVDDVERSTKHLLQARATFVSPGPVRLPDAALGYERACLVGDPDGHVLRLVEPVGIPKER